MSQKSFARLKRETIKIARELQYSKDTINKLRMAEKEVQLNQIMVSARQAGEIGTYYQTES